MKGLIELSNFGVDFLAQNVPLRQKLKVKASVKMYGKCMVKMFSTELFSMKSLYDLYLMHSQVVELEELYVIDSKHFKIH